MSPKAATMILAAGVVLLLGAIAIIAIGRQGGAEFGWGIHIITIPAVALVGVVIGWMMRDRQAAEERALEEITRRKEP